MNDDEVSVRAEAASAYLDGELDAAERASVAADPEAMALVETFTQLRNTLGELDPVADDVRAAAISAALAEFDIRQGVVEAFPVPSGGALAAGYSTQVLRLGRAIRREYRRDSRVADPVGGTGPGALRGTPGFCGDASVSG